MVVLAHLQGAAATFRVGRHHHRGPLHEGRGLTHALTHTAPTDLTVAAALVRKAYSKRRRSCLWSKPVNLRTWRLVSDPIAMVQALAELRYGVLVHTRENSVKYGLNFNQTPYGTGRLSNQKNQNILHTLCMRSGFWLVRLYYPLGSPARVPTRATCHVPPGLTSTNSNTHDTAYNTHTNDGTPACGMEQIIGTGKA